jgi:N,N'-diacetyllegionaminate synthase
MFERPDTGRAAVPAVRPDGRVTIVAEAAQGFEGDLTLARLLVRAAAAAGADVVKLQLVYARELTTPLHRHHALFEHLEMPDEAWHTIAADARREGVALAFDVFGPRSLDLAVACGAGAVKIHASDAFNDPLIDRAVDRAPHVWLSIGGVAPDEIAGILERRGSARDRVTLLYGFQAEPTPAADNHLARLGALRAAHPHVALGFMDHADGASDEAGWLATLALPFGVRLIEKHLTLDRALEIEDYVSAVAPHTFRAFVTRVRAAEDAIGSPRLELTRAESAYRRKALKVTVAARAIAAGSVIAEADAALLRTAMPESGTPLLRVSEAIGRRTARDLAQHAPILLEDLA